MPKLTNPHLHLPLLPFLDGGGGGYDWMQELQFGWNSVPMWGRDGWLLGRWPYVIVVAHDNPTRDIYGMAVYVEGDIAMLAFTSRTERDQAIDATAEFYWRSYGTGPDDLPPEGEPLMEHHCGPFSWERLDAERDQREGGGT